MNQDTPMDPALMDWLDGELHGPELEAFEVRLANEPELAADRDRLVASTALLRQYGPVSPPDDLFADILHAVETAPANDTHAWTHWLRRPFGVPIEGLAVAAAALLVFYSALPNSAPPSNDIRSGAAAPMSLRPESTNGIEAPTRSETADGRIATPTPERSKSVGTLPAGPASSKGFPLTKSVVEEKRLDTTRQAARSDAPVGTGSAAAAGATGKADGSPQNSGAFAQVPYSYTLYTADPEALLQLAAIAGRFRGEVAGPGDEPLALETMKGTDAATVIARIPAHALADFGRAIQHLGSVHQTADNSMFAGDPVDVRVRVKLEPASGTAQQ